MFRSMGVFLEVAKQGGFAAAARALVMSTTAVSRHVADLEQELGTALFRRTTRSVSLTDAGLIYRDRIRPLLEETEAVMEEMRGLGQEPRGHLRLAASPGFGTAVVGPLLVDFLNRWPAITLDLELSVHLVDPVRDGFDAAVRSGPLRDSGLTTRKLSEVALVACASPEFVERTRPITAPQDLAEVDCIVWREGYGKMPWSFRQDGRLVQVLAKGRFSSSSVISERQAALAGLGVALLPHLFVAGDLEAGRLREVLPGAEPLTINLVWPAQRFESPKLRALIDHLVDGLAGPLPRYG